MNNYFKKWNLIAGWFAFAVAALVYLLTMEPTASLWDCSEFIATSYKLEVGHPPGAPLFMMIARFFTMFAPDTAHVAVMVNAMSALASAFTILFLFWTITHLGRRLYGKRPSELTTGQSWAVIGAGLIGALAYTFTDTFWFSAVEGEVYALSSLFTAVVLWAILKWEDVADEPHANRWLILIAYLMGLSIGVHILNLLAIPAIVFVYYFRKTDKVTFKGVLKATAVAAIILLAINSIIIPYTAAIGAVVDRWFVNGIGLPINSGMIFFAFLLFAAVGFGVYYTHKKGRVVMNTILLCVGVILIGYSSYASVVIRANANPPMNSNDPDNPYALLYLLNRDQYGNKPVVYGSQYARPKVDMEAVYKDKYYIGEDGKYRKGTILAEVKCPSEFMVLFPRMWSTSDSHIEGYKVWGDVKDTKKIKYKGERVAVPTMGENLRYFFSYQLNFMYWRYFLWNFAGRQSDVQSVGALTDGQWLSGIDFIDEAFLGPQKNLPSEMKDNKARNKYYFLPFILGIIGLIYQLNRDPKNFSVVMWLFIMTGIALVVYFNTTPSEVRERDYVFAGSFYAFSIWIGLGVMCLRDWLVKLSKKDGVIISAAAIVICSCVPVVLAAQNWDDHDRSHRYVARDIGYNYLNSTLPNSIILNFGDNDTFPLWYAQEVENVRPDVRIMNMSYLGGGWYIEEMKRAYNESAPVPFSLPMSKYMYVNDYIYVDDVFEKPISITDAMDIIRSDASYTRHRFADNTEQDFMPAKTLILPVNKDNVIAAGIVKPEDAHLIEDNVVIELSKETLRKEEVMLIDLLANFDWKRPIYFTQPTIVRSLGLTDYLQFDGYAYRLVPIRTPYEGGYYVGRMDTEYVYEKLMNEFSYGNVSDPRVYVDYFTQYNYEVSQTRMNFARLADGLIDKGDKKRAREVLERGLTEVPLSQFRYNAQLHPYIISYYKLGDTEKGDELLKYAVNIQKEYISYYDSFSDDRLHIVIAEYRDRLDELDRLYRLAQSIGREEIVDDIQAYIEDLM